MTAAHPAGADAVYQAYLDALRAGDRRRAFHVVEEARADGVALATIYMEVLQPALREVGRLWQENLLSVAEEHLATAITQAVMAHTYGQTVAWGDEDGPTLLAACADTERHEVGLRMLCDLLECAGWSTTYLGATVPIPDLARMAARLAPDAVALSVTLPPHLPRLRAMVQAVREAVPAAGALPPLVLVGGRPLLADPALAERLGADLTAPDAAAAVRLLQERVPGRGRRAHASPAAAPLP